MRAITDDRHSFDIRFWQSQGDRAIFEAVSDMLHDYFLIRGKDADEFRLQKTVESFQKSILEVNNEKNRIFG
jgi:hypothetical protein